MPFLAPAPPTSNLSGTPVAGQASAPATTPAPTPMPVLAATPASTLSGSLVAGKGLAWLPFPLRLVKNNLLGTVSTAPSFELSFNIWPRGLLRGWTSLLQFTTGGGSGVGSSLPGIFFHSETTRLHVRMSRGKHWNKGCNTDETLRMNWRTHVRVQLHGNRLQVRFDGREVCRANYPEQEPGHANVKVYAGNPFGPAANALVWDIRYVPLAMTWLPSPTWPRRPYLLDKISTAVDFELTFGIKPTGLVLGWGSLLQFTKNDPLGVGTRLPGIWFHPWSMRLHVRMGRGPDWNAGCDPTETMPINRRTYVTVRLHGASLQVFFDNREVCKASYPTKEPGHMGVEVYSGDPWSTPARALVSDVRYFPLVTAT